MRVADVHGEVAAAFADFPRIVRVWARLARAGDRGGRSVPSADRHAYRRLEASPGRHGRLGAAGRIDSDHVPAAVGDEDRIAAINREPEGENQVPTHRDGLHVLPHAVEPKHPPGVMDGGVADEDVSVCVDGHSAVDVPGRPIAEYMLTAGPHEPVDPTVEAGLVGLGDDDVAAGLERDAGRLEQIGVRDDEPVRGGLQVYLEDVASPGRSLHVCDDHAPAGLDRDAEWAAELGSGDRLVLLTRARVNDDQSAAAERREVTYDEPPVRQESDAGGIREQSAA